MSNQPANENGLSPKEWAAADFDAVDVGAERIPSPELLSNPHLVSVRMAAAIMGQTKGELIDYVGVLPSEEFDQLLVNMAGAEALFLWFAEMLKGAQTRLRIALLAGLQ